MKHCPNCGTPYPTQYRTCPKDDFVLIEVRELEPGTVFHGVYRIIRLLGRGNMGVVYEAEHILLRQPRALKFMSNELASSPEAMARILREAQRASEIGLQQPNIVKTLDMGQSEDGSLFLCMELIDGPSLQKIIDNSPNGLKPERAMMLIRGIATGLGAAHAKGMVHRDIKPENILVALGEEGSEIPKIADFGIVTGRPGEAKITRIGVQPLTPGFAAPEQWKGLIPSNELDGRTDLYALGCVFFELLTGIPVFPGATLEQLRDEHVKMPPRSPSSVRPELANYRGLDELVLRLLSKERDGRPPDVKAFLSELDSVRPATAVPETLVEIRPKTEQAVHVDDKGAEADSLWWTVAARLFKSAALRYTAAAVVIASVAGGAYFVEYNLKQNASDSGGATDPAALVERAKSLLKNSPGPENSFGPEAIAQSKVLLKEACDRGNAQGCIALSQILELGHPTHEEHNEAQVALARFIMLGTPSCEGGNMDDCVSLAVSYEQGKGVKQDYQKARALYTKACDAGNGGGCGGLGLMYYLEEGVQKNPELTYRLLSQGCEKGDGTSCFDQASYLYSGEGVAIDQQRAATLRAKSCELGFKPGCEKFSEPDVPASNGKTVPAKAPSKGGSAAAGPSSPARRKSTLPEANFSADTPYACGWMSGFGYHPPAGATEVELQGKAYRLSTSEFCTDFTGTDDTKQYNLGHADGQNAYNLKTDTGKFPPNFVR